MVWQDQRKVGLEVSVRSSRELILESSYSSLEVSALTGVSLRQLQWWDEQRVVTPMQVGHRRLYNTAELLQVALIMGLRRKGLSLQKVRRILVKLAETTGGRVFDQYRQGAELYLLTDGELVHVESARQRVIEVLKESEVPMIMLSISDLISQCQLGPKALRRKPVGTETRPSIGRRAVRAS